MSAFVVPRTYCLRLSTYTTNTSFLKLLKIRQAYVRIDSEGLGEFQFGLVSGEIDGEIVEDGTDERFEFTWGGNDECDPA